jgi:hypothetical protein
LDVARCLPLVGGESVSLTPEDTARRHRLACDAFAAFREAIKLAAGLEEAIFGRRRD